MLKNNNLTQKRLTENIKTKYILANSVKVNKISTKLSKSLNNVINNKNFIGYDEDDYDDVEKICNYTDTNLFVKNKSIFYDNLTCKKNIIADKNIIGFTQSENLLLNTDSCLNVNGSGVINGNLHIKQSINVGFETETQHNKNSLNVNGNSNFMGNNIFHGNIQLNNSISLKEETLFNVIIENNIISQNDHNILLNNITNCIQNNNLENTSVLHFHFKNIQDIYSGLISVSKKFTISNSSYNLSSHINNEVYDAFVLLYVIYYNSKIISVKPIFDTFTIINANKNVVNINKHNTYKELIKIDNIKKDDIKKNIKNFETDLNGFEIVK